MANHGYVTSRKHIKPDTVNEIIHNLIQTKFNNVVTLDYNEEEQFWSLEYDGEEERGSLQFWLASKRKLEFRHENHPLMWWCEIQIQEAVASHYDGLMSDDGHDEKWKPQNNYPTYESWVTRWWSIWFSEFPPVAGVCKYFHKRNIPKNLRDLGKEDNQT